MTEGEQRLLENYRRMDQVEQVIFLAGLRGAASNALTLDQFQDRVRAMIDRHRAGEEIMLSEIKALEAGDIPVPE